MVIPGSRRGYWVIVRAGSLTAGAVGAHEPGEAVTGARHTLPVAIAAVGALHDRVCRDRKWKSIVRSINECTNHVTLIKTTNHRSFTGDIKSTGVLCSCCLSTRTGVPSSFVPGTGISMEDRSSMLMP